MLQRKDNMRHTLKIEGEEEVDFENDQERMMEYEGTGQSQFLLDASHTKLDIF